MENQGQSLQDMSEFATQKALIIKIIAKGWADEDYKRELMDNTNDVLIREGVKVPEGMTVHIVDVKQPSTPSDFYFAWPNPSSNFNVEKSEMRKAASSTGGQSATSGS